MDSGKVTFSRYLIERLVKGGHLGWPLSFFKSINRQTYTFIFFVFIIFSAITWRIIYDVYFYHDQLVTCTSQLNDAQTSQFNAEQYADELERQNNRNL